MVVAITVSSVANAVVISWKRQKLYFEFRVGQDNACIEINRVTPGHPFYFTHAASFIVFCELM